jgi:hypothetical protein
MLLHQILSQSPHHGAVLHHHDGHPVLLVPGPGHQVQVLSLRPCTSARCDCRDISATLVTADGADAIERIDHRGLWLRSGSREHRGENGAGGPRTEVLVLFDEGGVILREGTEETDPPEEAPYDERTTWVESFLDARVLDELATAFVRAKGMRLPTHVAVEPETLAGEDLTLLTPWSRVHPSLRTNDFQVDDGYVDVVDLHCLKPGCSCTTVHLSVGDRETSLGLAELDLATRSWTVSRAKVKDRGIVEAAVRAWLTRYGWRGALHRHADMRAYAQRLEDAGVLMRVPESAEAGHGATVRRADGKVGRNEPCPCGSGKKYKRCCDVA